MLARKNVFVLAFALIGLVGVGCAPCPGGRTHLPCLPVKTSPGLTLPPSYVQWNGQFSDKANLRHFGDASCTVPESLPHFVSFATVSSPGPPVPAGYASWVDVPPPYPYFGIPYLETTEYTAAVAACTALFGNIGSATLFTIYAPDEVSTLGNFTSDLWGCVLIDSSTTPLVQLRP